MYMQTLMVCICIHIILMSVYNYVRVILMAVYMYMYYQSLFICTCNTNECLYVDATLMVCILVLLLSSYGAPLTLSKQFQTQ